MNRSPLLLLLTTSSIALRVEWSTARAESLRWAKQCALLREEIDRTTSYHAWRGNRWEERVSLVYPSMPDFLEGANAYAYRQASLRQALAVHCRSVSELMAQCMSASCFGGDLLPSVDDFATV